MATTVTRKGQVAISTRVRDRPAIGPGSSVEFEVTPAGRFEGLRCLPGAGMPTDQIMDLTRGEP